LFFFYKIKLKKSFIRKIDLLIEYCLDLQGDDGGPIFIGNTIIGVNKGTCPINEFHPNKFNVQYNVMFYFPFIHEISNNC
jgi:hypothetical protein